MASGSELHLLVGHDVQILPPRDNHGKLIADREGLTGKTGQLVQANSVQATVVFADGGEVRFGRDWDRRVRILRKKLEVTDGK